MLRRRRIYQVDVLVNEKRIRRKRHGTTGGNRERSEEIGNRNQWWVHQAHGLAHWFRSHPTPSQPSVLPSPSAFPSWGIYITGSSLIGVASKTPRITSKNLISEQKVSANKLKQQAVKASYEHERQKYAETSQSIPSYSCPNGGKWLRSSHSEKKVEPEASFEILTNPAWVVP